jgi:hypothetical protein
MHVHFMTSWAQHENYKINFSIFLLVAIQLDFNRRKFVLYVYFSAVYVGLKNKTNNKIRHGLLKQNDNKKLRRWEIVCVATLQHGRAVKFDVLHLQ